MQSGIARPPLRRCAGGIHDHSARVEVNVPTRKRACLRATRAGEEETPRQDGPIFRARKAHAEEHIVKGAVLHKNTPRLLHVDGIEVEAPLERNLIYLRNRDVPGVIGKVGTILGNHKINIADFSLGRRMGNVKPDKPRDAIAVVHVDDVVPEAVLAELRRVPPIEQAKAIRLS